MVLNVITWSALISACEKGVQPERGLQLAKGMRRQRVVSNLITCNALISAFEKGKQGEGALQDIPVHAAARRGAGGNHLQRSDQRL